MVVNQAALRGSVRRPRKEKTGPKREKGKSQNVRRAKPFFVKALGEFPPVMGDLSQAGAPDRKKACSFCSWCPRFEGRGGLGRQLMAQVAGASVVVGFHRRQLSLVTQPPARRQHLSILGVPPVSSPSSHARLFLPLRCLRSYP